MVSCYAGYKEKIGKVGRKKTVKKWKEGEEERKGGRKERIKESRRNESRKK